MMWSGDLKRSFAAHEKHQFMEIYFKNITPEEVTADRLLHDLKTLKDDTEELFRATGNRIAEKSREKFLTAVDKARAACHEVQDQAVSGLNATDEVIRRYPFSAIGVAFGLGLLIGIIANRK
jgi:ElaB/YqjD/DUF883 family membrane-anchored ribosome-binding protein